MISLKIGGMVVAAFIAGAFIASPELRAYAAATVTSADIVDGTIQSIDIGSGQVKNSDIAGSAVTGSKIASNAVTTNKIADGQVMAADIAADAVGASEMQGVTKLIFSDCGEDFSLTTGTEGIAVFVYCTATGADLGDDVLATKNSGDYCYSVSNAVVYSTDTVQVGITNNCAATLS